MSATPPPTETMIISVVEEKGLLCGAAAAGKLVEKPVVVGSAGSVGRGSVGRAGSVGRGGSVAAGGQPPFDPPGTQVWIVLACRS